MTSSASCRKNGRSTNGGGSLQFLEEINIAISGADQPFFRKQKKAKILSDIAKSMQKRNAIEEDMMAVISGLNTTMIQLETRLMEVYDAKEREVQQLL